MTNNNTMTKSGERLSFYKLFKERGYHLEIPIIQRDYAQGRESSSEVREMFLSALYSYLEENLPNRDLDFVYGTIQNKGDERFIPLDGQQRLTTLFLLHWYLSNISGNSTEFREVLACEGKSRFTYETRTSSREFCDALISNVIDVNSLLSPDDGKLNGFSKTIRDRGWFYFSWENDPTIQSMLNMLDSIHVKFSNKPEFYGRLTDETKPVITFLFLNLDDFNLTDDLYIKMNSRGKQLTTFENFKAKFEQHIGKLEWIPAVPFKLEYKNDTKLVSPQEYFSFKIDTKWADLFWNYNNLHEKNNSFDDELMNFIRVIITNQYSVDCSKGDEQLEYLIGTDVVNKRKDYTDDITYHKYDSYGVLTNSSIIYLINAFDKLANSGKKIHNHLNESFYYDEHDIFEKVLKHGLKLPERVRFHAYIRYLIFNENDLDGISSWMRFIYNLTENSEIDGANEIEKAIKSVEKLLVHSKNIIEFLVGNPEKVDLFSARQFQEEKIKAHLIKKSTVWSDAVHEIEKQPYLAGQIGFIIEFSGILQYFETHGHCLWSNKEDENYFNQFNNYSGKARLVFDFIDSDKNADFLWERAVLTKGDYLIEASSHRYNFLFAKKYFRTYSWKRLLRMPLSNTDTKLSDDLLQKRMFVKNVFDDTCFDQNDLEGSLTKICQNKPSDWRQYFIDCPDLIKYCKQGFIRIESESSIQLYKESQQNHLHREMYTYHLYLNQLSKKEDFAPFERIWHQDIRSGEEYSCAVLDTCCINRINYAVKIHYNYEHKDNSKNKYRIYFYKTRGSKNQSDYPQEITDMLDTLKFDWDEDEPGFFILKKSPVNTISLINSLCTQLKCL